MIERRKQDHELLTDKIEQFKELVSAQTWN